VQKTGAKHHGKPIYSIACVVCGQRFKSLSKTGLVPEHNMMLRVPKEDLETRSDEPADPSAT
jgi:hypothetical protein